MENYINQTEYISKKNFIHFISKHHAKAKYIYNKPYNHIASIDDDDLLFFFFPSDEGRRWKTWKGKIFYFDRRSHWIWLQLQQWRPCRFIIIEVPFHNRSNSQQNHHHLSIEKQHQLSSTWDHRCTKKISMCLKERSDGLVFEWKNIKHSYLSMWCSVIKKYWGCHDIRQSVSSMDSATHHYKSILISLSLHFPLVWFNSDLLFLFFFVGIWIPTLHFPQHKHEGNPTSTFACCAQCSLFLSVLLIDFFTLVFHPNKLTAAT